MGSIFCGASLTCEFALCTGTLGPVNYVIDPCFREQFEIANPSPMYQRILSEVPHEFVGTEERIAALVAILSNEIRRSFQVLVSHGLILYRSCFPLRTSKMHEVVVLHVYNGMWSALLMANSCRQLAAPCHPGRHTASMLSKWRPRRSQDFTVPQTEPKEGKEMVAMPGNRRRVTITASSAASEEVVAAQPASDVIGAIKCKEALPRVEGPPKRARDFTLGGAKCSSTLASKLRGVSSFGSVGSFPSVFKGQA